MSLDGDDFRMLETRLLELEGSVDIIGYHVERIADALEKAAESEQLSEQTPPPLAGQLTIRDALDRVDME